MAKEQTNGGSKLNLRIGEFVTNEEKEITMPPEKAKKLTVVTTEKLEELEESGYIEVKAEENEVIKEKDGSITRVDSKTGKVLTGKKLEEAEK